MSGVDGLRIERRRLSQQCAALFVSDLGGMPVLLLSGFFSFELRRCAVALVSDLGGVARFRIGRRFVAQLWAARFALCFSQN